MALPEYTLNDRFRSSSGQRRYRLNIAQKYGFFLFWPGHSQKNAFLKRANKRIYNTLRFQEFILISIVATRRSGEKLQCKGS